LKRLSLNKSEGRLAGDCKDENEAKGQRKGISKFARSQTTSIEQVDFPDRSGKVTPLLEGEEKY